MKFAPPAVHRAPLGRYARMRCTSPQPCGADRRSGRSARRAIHPSVPVDRGALQRAALRADAERVPRLRILTLVIVAVLAPAAAARAAELAPGLSTADARAVH